MFCVFTFFSKACMIVIYLIFSGKINAHGFMATTQSITNQNFLEGKYNFNSTNNNPGNLTNYGNYNIANYSVPVI